MSDTIPLASLVDGTSQWHPVSHAGAECTTSKSSTQLPPVRAGSPQLTLAPRLIGRDLPHLGFLVLMPRDLFSAVDHGPLSQRRKLRPQPSQPVSLKVSEAHGLGFKLRDRAWFIGIWPLPIPEKGTLAA